MKRVAVIVLSLILVNISAFAGSYSAIEKLEKSLFGITYSNQDDKSRIERLEKNIYGEIQTGSIDNRITRLNKDMNADMIGQEIEPSKYTEFEEQEDNSVDYPLINKFEKEIFNQEFKNKRLEQRLSNLEKKIFNRIYDKDDLNTRTERLKTAINIPQKTNEDYFQNNEYYNNYPGYTPSDYETKEHKHYDANVAKILNALEKKILKKTYPNQNEEERIERLEENMFTTTFPNDSIESRLERLALAYKGSKTANKYDTNKISQHMATAMQVGMFLLMILAMVL